MLAVFCALRLARFNARIDADEQPHKSAGFLTGVPAPAGAGLALLPMFIWFWSEEAVVRTPWAVAIWAALIATLLISSVATYSWSSLKLRRNIRFEALAVVVLLAAALVSAPWQTLTVVCAIYLAAAAVQPGELSHGSGGCADQPKFGVERQRLEPTDAATLRHRQQRGSGGRTRQQCDDIIGARRDRCDDRPNGNREHRREEQEPQYSHVRLPHRLRTNPAPKPSEKHLVPKPL